ncbi:MAG: RHS repeat protein, partial [Acidobacteria bacterium]
ALGLICFCLLIFGALKVVAQEKKPNISFPRPMGRFAEKVTAVRERFAAEREQLGLSNPAEESGTPEAGLGEPDCSQTGGGGGGSSPSGASASSSPCGVSSKGAAVWKVNMGNLNTYVEDTPLWYRSPIGPSVEIVVSHNSLSPETGSVGNKWQLNYASYLSSALTGITVVMPDGRQDLFTSEGSGFRPPKRVFNTLVKVADNHYELKFPDGEVYVYRIPPGSASAFMVLVEIRDVHGQKLSLSHDVKGALQTITDAEGKITTFTYNSQGLLNKVTDPFGRSASFEYDGNKNLTKITDMGGYWTSFAYSYHSSSTYYLAGLGNPGRTWTFYYEPADSVSGAPAYPAPGAAMGFSSRLTVTNPSGKKEEFFKGGSIWHVSARHYVAYASPEHNNYVNDVPKTVYGFGGSGNIASVTSPEGNSTHFGYGHSDSYGRNTGRITDITKEEQGNLRFTYNSIGKATSVEGWSYPPAQMTYAPNGIDLVKVTDGLGTTSLTYNTTHDVTSVTDHLGNKTTFLYDEYGHPTSAIDPLGVTTNFTYDSDHRLSSATIAGQTVAGYTYDSIGRIRAYSNSAGLVRTYDYNNLDDVTKVTFPDGKSVNIAYSSDIPRLVTSITDRGGKTSRATYVSSGELTTLTGPDGGLTRFERDAGGNLVRLVDPKGNAIRFNYDDDNQIVKKTFADGTFVSFGYDKAGRLNSVTNARGASASYLMNASGQPAMTMYAGLPYTAPVISQYDAYNRRTSMIDGAGTRTYSYDAESRITGVSGPLTNDARTFQYDAKGRMTAYTVQGGQSVAYTYDSLDRLASIRNAAGTFSYAYLGASSLVQKLTRPNGSYTDYQYDSLYRLTGVANKTSAGAIINQFLYTYDEQDLRSSETITEGAPLGSFQAESTTYTHNRLNQLRTSTTPDRTFVYDADGNMTQAYAPDGFPLTIAYDFENRLTLIKFGQREIEYSYNGDGIVASKAIESDYEADSETNYVLFGSFALQERDQKNQVTREYTWGINPGGGIGGLLSMNQNGQDYFYLYDGKGNVTALINASQSVVASYTYDPFGRVVAKAGTLDQPYQFSTKPYDESTGLSYFGYRFYAPSLAKWMNRDPLSEFAGLNLYEFAGNNAINRFDPVGLDDHSDEWYEGDPAHPQPGAEMLKKAIEDFNRKCPAPAPKDPSKIKELLKAVHDAIYNAGKETHRVIYSPDPRTGFIILRWINTIFGKTPAKTPLVSPVDVGEWGGEIIDKAAREREKACDGCGK